MKILNSLSLNMIRLSSYTIKVKQISKQEAYDLLGELIESFVGHEDFAKIVSKELGCTVPYFRGDATLNKGEEAIVAQVVGGRLPLGTTVLPPGITIKWLLVKIE